MVPSIPDISASLVPESDLIARLAKSVGLEGAAVAAETAEPAAPTPPTSHEALQPPSSTTTTTTVLARSTTTTPEPPAKASGEGETYNSPGAARLKRLLNETKDLIVCPGVYDGLSARVAHEVGFQALYMTGAGTTAYRLGQPDLALAQLHDMKEHAEMIAGLEPYGAPLVADMDTGYGGPVMVANAVAQYIRAGVAGFHIEDQLQNKRCGHLKGKAVVPEEEFYTRLRAARQSKDRLRSDITLIARTDALQSRGYAECVRRLRTARDLGCDVGLLEGFTSKEQARRCVRDLAGWPLALNMVENGATPVITTDEAREMGFRIMIFSFATLAPAYVGIKHALEHLKTEGRVGTAKDLTPKRLFEVCGLEDSMAVDAGAGGTALSKV